MPESVLKMCEARDSLNSSVSPSLGAGGGGGGGGASFVFRVSCFMRVSDFSKGSVVNLN